MQAVRALPLSTRAVIFQLLSSTSRARWSRVRLLVALLASALLAPAIARADDNVVIQWDNATLQAVRVSKISPPAVARALAIVHTCMFDAWAAYDSKAVGTQLGATLRRPG